MVPKTAFNKKTIVLPGRRNVLCPKNYMIKILVLKNVIQFVVPNVNMLNGKKMYTNNGMFYLMRLVHQSVRTAITQEPL